jgi:diguanylate cyclase (GGDEF)-like protein
MSLSSHPENGLQAFNGSGTATVLVIHPEPEFRARLRAVLEKEGFQTLEADDGATGIGVIYQQLPNVVVSDIVVPEINGYQLCRLLKNDPVLQKIPFILISDLTIKIDKFWGFKANADAFIHRQDVQAGLAGQVRMLLQIYERLQQNGAPQRVLRPMLPTETAEASVESPNYIRTRLNQLLDKSLIEATVMTEFRSLCDLTHDKSLLNHMMFSLLESLIEYDVAAIFYNDSHKNGWHITLHLPEGRTLAKDDLESLKTDFVRRLHAQCPQAPFESPDMFQSQTIGLVDDKGEAGRFILDTAYQRAFFMDNELMGAVAFYSETPVQYERIFPVGLIENQIALLMKLSRLYAQAETLSVSDPLTGLHNYGHFMSVLEREFNRAKRYDLDLALAFVDIDEFKQFNDQWGHALGDEVLQRVSRIARDTFRNVDILSRYSGAQLAVLLPETNGDQALQACERFRMRVQNTPVNWKGTQLLSTVSVGIVTLHDSVDKVADLMRLSRSALQQAKLKGRNRTELSSF